MQPVVKEFKEDTALIEEIDSLSKKGVSKENLYVMSHDDDRTDRVAGDTDANKVGVRDESLQTAVGNIFRKKGDELRAKLKELNFTQQQADDLEGKLDQGKILLINTDPDF